MKVKCYNFNGVVKLLDYNLTCNTEDYDRWLEMVRSKGLIIFQQPKSPGSGRARKERQFYITTNEWFDQYMKEKNIWGVLKGKVAVKPCYRIYEKQSDYIIIEQEEVACILR